MKKTLILVAAGILAINVSNAQLLKKLKDKVNNAVNSATGTSNQTNNGTTTASGSNSSSGGTATNTRGGGLTNTTPPDVTQAIADAQKSQASGDYSNARYSIQQALMSVELQIGKQVLQSLPATVSGMQKDTAQNAVMSTQWGWNNLTIASVYKKGDQQMTVTIGNNPSYAALAAIYSNNAMYTQTTANDPNVKQTRLKNYKAVISYDNSKGYALLVPLGQTSLIAWDCVNFASEQDVMNAASSFDIDGIKKMLGEQ